MTSTATDTIEITNISLMPLVNANKLSPLVFFFGYGTIFGSFRLTYEYLSPDKRTDLSAFTDYLFQMSRFQVLTYSGSVSTTNGQSLSFAASTNEGKIEMEVKITLKYRDVSLSSEGIIKFTTNTYDLKVTQTSEEVTIKTTVMSEESLLNNIGCGPKIIASIEADYLKVLVEDKGYSYSVQDNKLVVKPSTDCELISSNFILPLLRCEIDIKTYILSGFVYGVFGVVENECYFFKRLLTTPFRNFISSFI